MMSENDLLRYVIDVAIAYGWYHYHVYHSKYLGLSTPGFPDLILLRDRLIIAEFKKKKTIKNKRYLPTEAQMRWINRLRKISGIEVYIWTPEDMDEIKNILR